MFGFPDDSDLTRRTPSELEQWARSEAKSGAMVRDVLDHAGVVEPQFPTWLRQLFLTAGTLSLALGMCVVGALFGSLILTLTATEGNDRTVSATDDGEGAASENAPRLAGPFRP